MTTNSVLELRVLAVLAACHPMSRTPATIAADYDDHANWCAYGRACSRLQGRREIGGGARTPTGTAWWVKEAGLVRIQLAVAERVS